MKTVSFEAKLWLPKAREQIFAFFADPRNLDKLTPAWLRFEIVTPEPMEMRKGTRLDYKLRLHGIPIRWQSEIAGWEPPLRFVDRQTRGPYRLWIHEHNFISKHGGTIVEDRVEYATPGGGIVQKLLVAPDLRRIFSYRHKVLRNLFAGDLATSTV